MTLDRLWFSITVPWSHGSGGGFLMVRSRGTSWSAMRSLLRTGFWFCADPVRAGAGLPVAGAPVSKGGAGRLWSVWGWDSEQLSWGELVFEVYSAANFRIIFWRISRATTGMCGSEKFGTSGGGKKKTYTRLKNSMKSELWTNVMKHLQLPHLIEQPQL